MGTLKVGDVVVYNGGLLKQHEGEVGTIRQINGFYSSLFISMDLITPKKIYHSPTVQSTMTGMTAPIKYFKLYTQGWEV